MKKFTLLVAVLLLVSGFAGMASASPYYMPSGLIKAVVALGSDNTDVQDALRRIFITNPFPSGTIEIINDGWTNPSTGTFFSGGQLNSSDWSVINGLTINNETTFALNLGFAQQSIPSGALNNNGYITSLGVASLDVVHQIGINALRYCYRLSEIRIAGEPLSFIMPYWTDSQKIALGRVLMSAGIEDEYQASDITGLSVMEIYRLYDQAYYEDFSVCGTGIPSALLLPVLFALAIRRKR